VIDRVIETLGIETFYLSPLDDIAAAKQIIAGRALCAGVINDIKLIDWSKEEIRNEVRRMIDAGMPGGKFFFGTLVMPYGIPGENIKAMLSAAYQFGSYADRGYQ
jgi:uroporphyrinogen decarboxylase